MFLSKKNRLDFYASFKVYKGIYIKTSLISAGYYAILAMISIIAIAIFRAEIVIDGYYTMGTVENVIQPVWVDPVSYSIGTWFIISYTILAIFAFIALLIEFKSRLLNTLSFAKELEYDKRSKKASKANLNLEKSEKTIRDEVYK